MNGQNLLGGERGGAVRSENMPLKTPYASEVTSPSRENGGLGTLRTAAELSQFAAVLAKRIEAFEEKLLGAQPQTTESSAEARRGSTHGGIIGGIEEQHVGLAGNLGAIHNSLNRLERFL